MLDFDSFKLVLRTDEQTDERTDGRTMLTLESLRDWKLLTRNIWLLHHEPSLDACPKTQRVSWNVFFYLNFFVNSFYWLVIEGYWLVVQVGVAAVPGGCVKCNWNTNTHTLTVPLLVWMSIYYFVANILLLSYFRFLEF